MKKYTNKVKILIAVIVAAVVIIVLLLLNNLSDFDLKRSAEVTVHYTNDSHGDGLDGSDIPGNVGADTVIESVADYAEFELNIFRADTQINLDPWLVADELKGFVKEYRSITLKDGTIIGYVIFEKDLLINNDEFAENSKEKLDYLVDTISEIAMSMNRESHTEYGIRRMFFIISDPGEITVFIGYLTNSTTGSLASLYYDR